MLILKYSLAERLNQLWNQVNEYLGAMESIIYIYI
jgi:hypothetical protein